MAGVNYKKIEERLDAAIACAIAAGWSIKRSVASRLGLKYRAQFVTGTWLNS